MARDGNPLKGFSFCTLERIGGTPSVLIGLASIKRTSKRDAVLRAIMADQMRRALMAFPDEDVLVGMRINDVSGFNALANLTDVIPRPEHRASGEERAWGARLAKRFGVDDRRLRRPLVPRPRGQELPRRARPRDAAAREGSTRLSTSSSLR